MLHPRLRALRLSSAICGRFQSCLIRVGKMQPAHVYSVQTVNVNSVLGRRPPLTPESLHGFFAPSGAWGQGRCLVTGPRLRDWE